MSLIIQQRFTKNHSYYLTRVASRKAANCTILSRECCKKSMDFWRIWLEIHSWKTLMILLRNSNHQKGKMKTKKSRNWGRWHSTAWSKIHSYTIYSDCRRWRRSWWSAPKSATSTAKSTRVLRNKALALLKLLASIQCMRFAPKKETTNKATQIWCFSTLIAREICKEALEISSKWRWTNQVRSSSTWETKATLGCSTVVTQASYHVWMTLHTWTEARLTNHKLMAYLWVSWLKR